MKTILILAPHTDDGEFGCGGSIAKHIRQGDNVYYIAFSTCEESVPEGFPKNILETEVKDATNILGIPNENLIIKNYPVRYFEENRQKILEDLVELNKRIQPDVIYTPCSFDIHQDHTVIHRESKRAFKKSCILGYEFVWNNFAYAPTFFNTITEEDFKKKMQSIHAYKSQGFREYAKEENIKAIATFRGLQIGKPLAESFELIRWID